MPCIRGISPKAVLFGLLADVCSTLVVGVVAGVVMAVILIAQGAKPDELDELDALTQEPIVLIPSFVIGLGCTVFGGFVAGRVGGQSEVLHGGLVGVLGVVLGLTFWSFNPLWFNVACLVAVVPFAMLGGRLAVIRRVVAPRESDDERGAAADPTHLSASVTPSPHSGPGS